MSTRPSVSTIVFWPVKYGWQAEQVFTCISGLVERLCMTLPHAHVIVASPYLGWIPSFIYLTFPKKLGAYDSGFWPF